MMILAQTVVPAVDPIGLPAAPAWFIFLLLLTMLLHVLFMNLALGGSILALVLNAIELFARRDNGVAETPRLATNRMTAVIYQVMPVGISMAITMGVAPLLFVQVLYGPFFYSATVLLGLAWFAIVLLLLLGFYLTYLLTYRASNALQRRIGKWDDKPGRRLLVSAVAVACFLSIGWTLSHNHELSIHPEHWPAGAHWTSPRFYTPTPTLLLRYMHDVTGATAIAGVWLASIGWWLRHRGASDPKVPSDLIRFGLRAAMTLTMLQILLGFSFLLKLDEPMRSSVLGFKTVFGSIWTCTLVLAVLLPFALMHAVQQPDQFTRFAIVGANALLVVCGMLIGREQLRTTALARPEAHGFSIGQWAVYPQQASLLVFLVLLVAGLATVGLMLYWILDRRPTATSEPPLPPTA